MKGTVLFINRVYPPKSGATGEMLRDLAEYLAENGWRVTVITSKLEMEQELPNPPNIKIIRSPWGFFSRKSMMSRVLGYALTYPLFLAAALRERPHDFVVLKTDPPLLQVIGPIIKGIKGGRLIHWAQDVYPEVASELGVIPRDSLLFRCMRRLSTTCLRRYEAIVCVGRCMKSVFESRRLSSQVIQVIPNWSQFRSIHPVRKDQNRFYQEQGLAGHFVVMYSGNFGLAHEFDWLLTVCMRLQIELPNVLFLLIGDGPGLRAIQSKVKAMNLLNTRFLPFQPSERLAESLSSADIHLVSMRDNLCGLVVPSKGYAAFGSGKPVLFIGPEASEMARIIKENQLGHVFASNQIDRIICCLRDYLESSALLLTASESASAFSRVWNRNRAGEAFEAVLTRLKSQTER